MSGASQKPDSPENASGFCSSGLLRRDRSAYGTANSPYPGSRDIEEVGPFWISCYKSVTQDKFGIGNFDSQQSSDLKSGFSGMAKVPACLRVS
jgi:hypothetical protein